MQRRTEIMGTLVIRVEQMPEDLEYLIRDDGKVMFVGEGVTNEQAAIWLRAAPLLPPSRLP